MRLSNARRLAATTRLTRGAAPAVNFTGPVSPWPSTNRQHLYRTVLRVRNPTCEIWLTANVSCGVPLLNNLARAAQEISFNFRRGREPLAVGPKLTNLATLAAVAEHEQ